MVDTMSYDSPVGRLLLAQKEEKLVGLWMEGQKYFLGSIKEETRMCAGTEVLNQAKDWLDRYFQGKRPKIGELPLAPYGSEFRREVWGMLCEIPYGEVTTYGELSKRIASRRGLATMSAQAAGGAVGHNPISIVIPCHRVVGSDKSLTGYAGGMEKKRWLLALEGISCKERNGKLYIL